MLILLHAIWFPYMLANLMYPEQSPTKQREQKEEKQQPCISHYLGNVSIYENPVAWENSCCASIRHGVFEVEEKNQKRQLKQC